jgi:hypothetical protein
MATSPNFNWPEPDNTDLVKNGALAIRTAVDAIDSSLVDLKGGTTGQVLSKTSATDMDFSWTTSNQGFALQEVIYYTSNATFTKASYPNARAINVKCVGAGGGSGGAATTGASQVATGSGGGGGAYAESLIPIASVGASESITVGAGGSGGAAGNNAGSAGGSSSFGSIVIAAGGNGGAGGPANPVPTMGNNVTGGGTVGASTGQLIIPGRNSNPAIQVGASFPMRPLSGYSIYSKAAGGDIIATTGVAGAVGSTQGGGASGGVNAENQGTARAGAAGGAGIVIVEVLS